MIKKFIEKCLKIIQDIFFKKIGKKLKSGSLKNSMDILFVLSEKVFKNFDILSYNYIKTYYEIVEKEIQIAKITEKDKILIIGGGTIPATAIVLAEKSNANITAIDYNEKTLKNSIKFINKFAIKNKIKLEYGDGSNYPLKNYTVIFVLHGVKKQNEVLTHISKNINQTTKVIYRASLDIKGDIQKGAIDLTKFFQIKQKISSKSLGSVDSFLLMKKL